MATKRSTSVLHMLTAREIIAAGDGDHIDGGGLQMRRRGDAVSWVFRFTSPTGRRREMGLGVARLGSVAIAGDSLSSARKAARDARDQLERGIDPLDARRGQREKAKSDEQAKKVAKVREHLTLARASRDYHKRVIEPTKTDKHGAQWIASLEKHVPPSVWHKPISDITAPELLLALSQVRADPTARNLTTDDRIPETLRRIRQRLDKIFEDAIFHGQCGTNPAAGIRSKMREQAPPRAEGKFSALPYRKAPALFEQVREAEGTAARCLEFSILTACRTNESLQATWSEFDLAEGLWVVPAGRMKGKEEHTVYLPPRAVEILRGQLGVGTRYVFPSPMSKDQSKPMSNMAMLSTLDRLGVRGETTVHGLCRATFSTWAYETGAARPDVIEACLAHKEADKVKRAYNRALFNDERRALLLAWATFLVTSAGSNVVPFDQAA